MAKPSTAAGSSKSLHSVPALQPCSPAALQPSPRWYSSRLVPLGHTYTSKGVVVLRDSAS
jgi:hypothetical protein